MSGRNVWNRRWVCRVEVPSWILRDIPVAWLHQPPGWMLRRSHVWLSYGLPKDQPFIGIVGRKEGERRPATEARKMREGWAGWRGEGVRDGEERACGMGRRGRVGWGRRETTEVRIIDWTMIICRDGIDNKKNFFKCRISQASPVPIHVSLYIYIWYDSPKRARLSYNTKQALKSVSPCDYSTFP